MKIHDRVLLLLTGLLAAYQIVVGIEGCPLPSIGAYTVGFGVLLLAGLLLLIFGFEILESTAVVIVSTVIPLSLSLGLVWEYLPSWRWPYLALVIAGFAAVVLTRLYSPGIGATVTLTIVHGIAGLLIVGLPVALSLTETVAAGFALVGVGGALIGVGGLLLSFLKAGKPILSQKTILRVLPGLLLLMMVAFVAGFSFT